MYLVHPYALVIVIIKHLLDSLKRKTQKLS